MSLFPFNFGILKKKKIVEPEKEFDLFEEDNKSDTIPIKIVDDVSDEKLLIEDLAKFAHDQWVISADHILNNYTPKNIIKWKSMVKLPYRELTERERDSDREVARKIIDLVKGRIK